MNTIIKLAPGHIGWFDPITSIHLTMAKNKAIVKPGMNLTNIKSALADRIILIEQGILETPRQLSVEPITIKTEEVKKVTIQTKSKKKKNKK